nr:MAG TPA: hypothetical protein [Caudoviricetes sp.]
MTCPSFLTIEAKSHNPLSSKFPTVLHLVSKNSTILS